VKFNATLKLFDWLNCLQFKVYITRWTGYSRANLTVEHSVAVNAATPVSLQI